MIRHKSIGTTAKSFSSKSAALKWSIAQEQAIESGALGRLSPSEVTLGELLKRYLYIITPSKRGADVERRRLRRLIKDDVSSYQLDRLSSQANANFRDRRLLDGRRTCQYDLILIRHCIKLAINEWGLMLSTNPVDKVKLPSSSRSRDRRLNTGEFERLEKAACLTQNPHIWPIVVFAIETGMRRGEILGITWECVDFDSRTVHLPITKNGSSRDVPLSSKATQILKGQNERQLPCPFPVTDNAFRLAWDRLRSRADLGDLRFHDLRHEAISRFFEMGLSMPEVALISGHKDPRMLFRYTHIKPENVLAKLN
ncbi:MAG: site-specific integrase [Alphaproteobacteria bacterium]